MADTAPSFGRGAGCSGRRGAGHRCGLCDQGPGARSRSDLRPAAGRAGDDTILGAAGRHHRLDQHIADGIKGRRPIPAVLDDLLLVADDAVLVQEASIVAGMRMLLDHAGLVVEPSAALGVAAILEDRDRFAGRHVVTIVCGSNVEQC